MSTPRGFTLLELSVVVGAGALMLALVLPSYSSIRKDVAVGGYADQIANALQTAQNRAITSQGGIPWGVHFGFQTDPPCGIDPLHPLPSDPFHIFPCYYYVLYGGSWLPSSAQVSPTTYIVGNGITIKANALAPNCEIVFSHLSGSATNSCATPLQVGVGSIQKTITVGSTGQVTVSP